MANAAASSPRRPLLSNYLQPYGATAARTASHETVEAIVTMPPRTSAAPNTLFSQNFIDNTNSFFLGLSIIAVLLAGAALGADNPKAIALTLLLGYAPYIFFAALPLRVIGPYLTDRATSTTSLSIRSFLDSDNFRSPLATAAYLGAFSSALVGYGIVNATHITFGVAIMIMLMSGSALPNGYLNANQMLELLLGKETAAKFKEGWLERTKYSAVVALALFQSLGGSVAMMSAVAQAAAQFSTPEIPTTEIIVPHNHLLFFFTAIALMLPSTIQWILSTASSTQNWARKRLGYQIIEEQADSNVNLLRKLWIDILKDPLRTKRFIERMEAQLRSKSLEIKRIVEQECLKIPATTAAQGNRSLTEDEQTKILNLAILGLKADAYLKTPYENDDLFAQATATDSQLFGTGIKENIFEQVVMGMAPIAYPKLSLRSEPRKKVFFAIALLTAAVYCYISATEIPKAAETPGTGWIGTVVGGFLSLVSSPGNTSEAIASSALNSTNFIYPLNFAYRSLDNFWQFFKDFTATISMKGPSISIRTSYTLAIIFGLGSVGTVAAMGAGSAIALTIIAAASAALLNSLGIAPEVMRMIWNLISSTAAAAQEIIKTYMIKLKSPEAEEWTLERLSTEATNLLKELNALEQHAKQSCLIIYVTAAWTCCTTRCKKTSTTAATGAPKDPTRGLELPEAEGKGGARGLAGDDPDQAPSRAATLPAGAGADADPATTLSMQRNALRAAIDQQPTTVGGSGLSFAVAAAPAAAEGLSREQ